ncbi:hypothetical protein RGUI_0132 [Rhodovulum sp. P5]|uniref:delta-class carbonic anhydrase n=1 Tax=Rhodovulum sp. P5 TaxID=1564506 RepID=UPI0009C27541|nr:delta-class carbonic anhydrase [Rhodovulum sp. P5]ARE38273.1 hypothetical protein RGUI_0132 [Rhodovulum sp. P5]
MPNAFTRPLAAVLGLTLSALPAAAADICQGFGPQAPRDIASIDGTNTVSFDVAPPASEMVLCDIHTHTNAEHKGPGFSKFAGATLHGGYECSGREHLTPHELFMPKAPRKHFGDAAPGDTLEVHWVYTTCGNATAGHGLGTCIPEGCENPQLRVESQVFLLVNNPHALDFMDFAYQGHTVDGRNQPRALPEGTGEPVVFLGSTTGPVYTSQECSPYHVTWSVRPNCAKLDINSLYEWGHSGNPFEEHHSHGVRQLVTAPELLSPIN